MAVSRMRAAVAAQQSYQGPIGGQAGLTYNPLAAGITWHAAWWAEDPLWTPGFVDGQSVDWWRDGGQQQVDLVQADTAKQPIWYESVDAMNGHAAIKGDGSNDFLQTANWSGVLAQTYLTYCVFTVSANSKVIYDGNDVTNRGLFWRDGSGNWEINNGSIIQAAGADTSAHLATIVADGASSQIIIDGTSLVTGNAGAAGLDGLTLFANNAGAACNAGHVAFMAVISGANWIAQAAKVTEFGAWALDYYGIS